MRKLLRHYPLSLFIALVIWVLCLIPIPETPLSHVRLIDKWTHIAMYLVFTLSLWLESIYGSHYPWLNEKRHQEAERSLMPLYVSFIYFFLIPSLMGGLIELAQAYCTGGRRSGDWLDWLADTIGVVLATILGTIVWRIKRKVSGLLI